MCIYNMYIFTVVKESCSFSQVTKEYKKHNNMCQCSTHRQRQTKCMKIAMEIPQFCL